MNPLTFTPIGTIHSPFTDPEEMPIQPAGAREATGTVVIDPAYEAGLLDLEGFSHLYGNRSPLTRLPTEFKLV